MTEYHKLPGMLYFSGIRFTCPCGNKEFKVEIGPVPERFWCTCGAMYTEEMSISLLREREDISEVPLEVFFSGE